MIENEKVIFRRKIQSASAIIQNSPSKLSCNSRNKINIIEKFDQKLTNIKEYLKNSTDLIMNSKNNSFKIELLRSIFMNGDDKEKLLEDTEENMNYLLDLLNLISPIFYEEVFQSIKYFLMRKNKLIHVFF